MRLLSLRASVYEKNTIKGVKWQASKWIFALCITDRWLVFQIY